jgi:hypothetical protein
LRKHAKRKFMSPEKESIESSCTEDVDEDSDTSITSPKTESKNKKQKMGEPSELRQLMTLITKQGEDSAKSFRKMEDKIDKQSEESKEQYNELKDNMSNIKSDVTKVKDDISRVEKRFENLKAEMVDKMKEQIAEIKQETTQQEARKVETKRAFVDLEARMEENIKEQIAGMKQETVQQEARKKEVIMFRIEESNEHEDNNDYVKSEVLKALKCFSTVEELDVAFCRRIGPKRPKKPNIPRPVIVRLKTVAKRDDILDLANQNGIAGVEENLTKIQQAAKKIMLDDMKTKNEEAGQRAFKMVGRSGIYKLVKQNPRRESEMTT